MPSTNPDMAHIEALEEENRRLRILVADLAFASVFSIAIQVCREAAAKEDAPLSLATSLQVIRDEARAALQKEPQS